MAETATPLLSVRGLNAWYGESHVLHGVDFDVRAGEPLGAEGGDHFLVVDPRVDQRRNGVADRGLRLPLRRWTPGRGHDRLLRESCPSTLDAPR